MGTTIVLDLHSDLFGRDLTHIVAPLRLKGRHELLPRPTPEAVTVGKRFVVHVPVLATVAHSELGQSIGSLGDHRDEPLCAIDISTGGL